MESVVIDRGFWAGRTVLVTGHTGFKGTWLSLWLHELGARVVGYALAPPSIPNLFEDANAHETLIDIRADIRDAQRFCEVVGKYRPQVIFHMAAQSLVRASYNDPRETFDVNFMGTVNVLEALRGSAGVEASVIITTDKVYQNDGTSGGYNEDSPLGAADPYSTSKAACELAIASYKRSFFDKAGTPVVSARAGNVIGGGDWAQDRLVPDIVRAYSQSEPVFIRYPNSLRPWQHVLEPLAGYIVLAQATAKAGRAPAGAFNFGPLITDCQAVSSVVEKISELWGAPPRWTTDNSPKPLEAATLLLDSTRAREFLGWRPLLGLDRALSWTISWYGAQRAGASPRALCLEQISQYQELMS